MHIDTKPCTVCEGWYKPSKRSNFEKSLYCSNKCKQSAQRSRAQMSKYADDPKVAADRRAVDYKLAQIHRDAVALGRRRHVAKQRVLGLI